MPDDVQLRFGASVGDLSAGVAQVKAQIASIRAPVDDLISGFRELGKAIGAAWAQRRSESAWHRFSAPIARGLSDALTNAVLGIRTSGGLREIMLGLEKSVVGGMMSNLVKGLGDTLVKPLFTGLIGQGGIVGGLANLLLGNPRETTKISLLSIIAANTGATAAAAGATAAATGTSAVTGPLGSLGGGILGGGFFGSIFKGIGSFFTSLFAQGGIVPTAAGGWALPAFAGAMPALLHSREMVLPADIAQGLQGLIRGGGTGEVHVHLGFHGPADGASIGRWFAQNRGALAAAVGEAWNAGALSWP
jgi:hypothetical protein